MVITGITRKRSRKPRYVVRLDDSESLEITEETLQKFGLRTGDTLDPATLAKIEETDATASARTVAINYLSYRPRSSKEVQDHLVRKGINADIAQRVVQRLCELRLVDDVEFARMFLRDRLKRGRSGEILLRQQLLAKGIARAVADRVLDENVSARDMQDTAVALARKRLARERKPHRRPATDMERERLYQYLLRRGFSSDIARQTVRSLFPA